MKKGRIKISTVLALGILGGDFVHECICSPVGPL